jgi:hypothetical protein
MTQLLCAKDKLSFADPRYTLIYLGKKIKEKEERKKNFTLQL